jgi:hypothetical protein
MGAKKAAENDTAIQYRPRRRRLHLDSTQVGEVEKLQIHCRNYSNSEQ